MKHQIKWVAYLRVVSETKAVHQAIGSAGYERKPVEHASMAFRRSIYFIKDISRGTATSWDLIVNEG